jgi:hypothetical protein
MKQRVKTAAPRMKGRRKAREVAWAVTAERSPELKAAWMSSCACWLKRFP